MIIKKVQNSDNQNTLLIVHDESGRANDLINRLYRFLEDQVIHHQSGNLPNTSLVERYFLSEIKESEE